MTDWTPKFSGYPAGVNYLNTFRVEDGMIKVRYDRYEAFNGQFGHLFYKKPYAHYRLRMEYRFVGQQTPGGPAWARANSGVMIHCQAPITMGKDQDFPVCIEVQCLGGDGEHERPTANLCTPGTNVVMDEQLRLDHCINSTSATYHGDQWVTMEVEVRRGDVIRHILDGQVVLEYSRPQLDERDADAARWIEHRNGNKMLDRGYIALQAESHPLDIRKVEILVLDP